MGSDDSQKTVRVKGKTMFDHMVAFDIANAIVKKYNHKIDVTIWDECTGDKIWGFVSQK